MDAVLAPLRSWLGVEAVREVVLGWLPGVVSAALTVVFFWAFWRAARVGLDQLFERVDLDRTAAAFVRSVIRFGVGAVAVLTALNQLGVDTSSVLASLGVLGLTLGFAARDTLANVISGLFIFWDRPFILGDLVEIDGEYGRVEAITLRSVRLVTPDGRMFAIPNAVVAASKVASYTNFPNLRLDMEVTVGVHEDIGRVRKALLSTVAGHEGFLTEPAPVVQVTNLGDYNITVELQAWLRDETAHPVERPALRERILEAARREDIEMPFQTIALTPVEVMQRAPAA